MPYFFFVQLIGKRLIAQRSIGSTPGSIDRPIAEFRKSPTKYFAVSPGSNGSHGLFFGQKEGLPARAVIFEQAAVVAGVDPALRRLGQ